MFELAFLGLNNSVCSTQITYNDYMRYSNSNTMPPVISYNKAESSYSIAKSLFPDMRSFTKTEQQAYNSAISKLYKPTGIKLF